MKKQTKTLILSIVVTLILLLTFTVTYAAFVYRQTGEDNHQLVLGDIYMHYTETNSGIDIDNMMPININDYTTYKVNPVMATQEASNELTRCIDFFELRGINEYLDEGSTVETYCQGIGTRDGGMTMQTFVDVASDAFIQYMLSLNIIIQDGDSYKVNPVMATQEVVVVDNELARCNDYFVGMGIIEVLDEGSTTETFCQGTGTISGGNTMQNLIEQATNENIIQEMLSLNIIVQKLENLEYFEFTISGKNTYKQKDIWYDIVLNHGNVPEGKLEKNRINDEFLRFALYEVLDDNTEKNIFLNKNYSSLENKRIHVETIPKNTTEEINKTYRLYMWIDNDVVIGNVGEDYTTEEWKDVFASIKVNVTGDFNEKELDYEAKYNVTDASCFTSTVENNEVTITDYDTTCGTDVVIPKTINGNSVTTIGNNAFTYNQLTSIVIPNSVATIGNNAFEDNKLTSIVIPDSVTTIGVTAFSTNRLTSVVIPDSVTTIGESAFRWNQLTSVEIPDSVTTIGESAFANNRLTSVVIPNSVTTIESNAFGDNQLTSVIFQNDSHLENIDSFAFYGSEHTIDTVTIPESVIFLSCDAFNNDVVVNKSSSLTCTPVEVN